MEKKPAFAIKSHDGTEDGMELDVAIIGGGVSGLYTGWRLRTGQSKRMGAPVPSVHLFEMSDRLGGKLETIFFPGMENVPAHIGGMRYTEDMVMVTSLIRRVLHLEEVPFNMGESGHHMWYLRGVRLFEKDYEDVRKVPYGLTAQEQTYLMQQQDAKPGHYRTYNALLEYALERIIGLKQADWPQDREGWDRLLETLEYRGRPIYEYGFWNLLSEVVSSEAYKLITDAAGYETLTANVSAGEAIEFICLDFTQSVTYKALRWGYDCLPLALAERFTHAGGQIWRGSRLVKVEEATGHSRRLALTMAHRDSGAYYTVYADQVVLALPKRALELIDLSAFEAQGSPYAGAMQTFRRNREAVFGQPAFKLFMAYENPWWQSMGFQSGRSITDLPIRQCYYFGTVHQPVPGAANQPDRALLMASYDDASTVSYWRGLEWTDQELKDAPRYRGQGELSRQDTPGDVLGATPEMIRHAQAQLEEMHGQTLPAPLYAAYKDWSQDPYGGGWHLWNVGADVKQVMKAMRNPVEQLPLYVTGEAYSSWQGWVEGALTVTENLLQESFDLAAPSEWLYVEDPETKERRPYYLGW